MNKVFGRKVGLLLTGSLGAQVLPIAISPILSRQYGPDDFGQFGLYIAVVSVLTTLANLKFDNAILLADSEGESARVLVLCALVSAALALLLGLVIFVAPAEWFRTGWMPIERTHATILPFNVLIVGITNAMTAYLLRAERFALVAKVRFIQAFTTVLASLGIGAWTPSGMALIFSSILGQVLGMSVLIKEGWKRFRPHRGPSYDFLRTAACHRRFALYTAPSDLLNSLGSNLPLLFIGSTYGTSAAGAYTLAQRALGAPLMLVASAFTEAYRQSAAKSHSETGGYWQITVQTMSALVLIAIIPAVVCISTAPALFPFVFGNEWETAGEIVQILSVAYFMRLVVSPISYNYMIAHRNYEDLVLQVCTFIATVALFRNADYVDMPLIETLIRFAAVMLTMYTIYAARSLQFAWNSCNRAGKAKMEGQ